MQAQEREGDGPQKAEELVQIFELAYGLQKNAQAEVQQKQQQTAGSESQNTRIRSASKQRFATADDSRSDQL